MFTGDKNIKDSPSDLDIAVRDNSIPLTYTKLNKLITALYIVTDIMDKEEPVRLKLRTFGANIISLLSDISSVSRTQAKGQIQLTLTFLDIALSVKLISEMNFSILKKEFNELGISLDTTKEEKGTSHTWLAEFLQNSPKELPHPSPLLKKERENAPPNISRKQRRDDILKAIVDNGGNATITEVRAKASVELATCGEKTLQRELVSMVQEGLLKKEGQKRWSRYAVINSL